MLKYSNPFRPKGDEDRQNRHPRGERTNPEWNVPTEWNIPAEWNVRDR